MASEHHANDLDSRLSSVEVSLNFSKVFLIVVAVTYAAFGECRIRQIIREEITTHNITSNSLEKGKLK